MADVQFNVISNVEAVRNGLESGIEKGLWMIGARAETYAKEDTPVDTGRLINSIAHAEDERHAYIGTNVEYAPPVEEGSIHNKAHHMLRNAAANHWDEYKKIMEAALKSGE